MKNDEFLAKKKHWDDIYAKNFNFVNFFSNLKLFESYYHFVLLKIMSRFFEDGSQNIIEVGCAPGNYLAKFKKKFGAYVYGVEYSENGYRETVDNLKKYGIPSRNIFLEDFFSPAFLEKNREKYAVVFSAGFIEHFKNPEEVVRKHADLAKKGGLVVCLVPNKKYFNALFTSRESLAIHNRKIMSVGKLKESFEGSGLSVLYCNFFGGIINVGSLQTKTMPMKIVRMVLFAVQKMLLDNLQKIYFKVTGRDPVSRYSSPSLLCIAKKS